jgi:hypothetical protein
MSKFSGVSEVILAMKVVACLLLAAVVYLLSWLCR